MQEAGQGRTGNGPSSRRYDRLLPADGEEAQGHLSGDTGTEQKEDRVSYRYEVRYGCG